MYQDIWILQPCASVWLRMDNNNYDYDYDNNNYHHHLFNLVLITLEPTFPLTLGCQGGSPSSYAYDIIFISILFS
jgi:hypothetical protein